MEIQVNPDLNSLSQMVKNGRAVERSVGAVLFHNYGGLLEYLVIKHRAGHWELPKGHVEEGEGTLDTVIREVIEETGIHGIKLIPGFINSIEYVHGNSGKRIYKKVIFFLAESSTKEVKLSDEHLQFAWFPYEKAITFLTHENVKRVLKDADSFLTEVAWRRN